MQFDPLKINLRWSDLDPNFHLRHSSYYDLASQARIDLLAHHELSVKIMEEQHVAPVLLREECVFSREIKYTDIVFIIVRIRGVSDDWLKWIIEHEFIDDHKKKKALLTVEISWLNTQTRRIAKPLPDAVMAACRSIMGRSDVR